MTELTDVEQNLGLATQALLVVANGLLVAWEIEFDPPTRSLSPAEHDCGTYGMESACYACDIEGSTDNKALRHAQLKALKTARRYLDRAENHLNAAFSAQTSAVSDQ